MRNTTRLSHRQLVSYLRDESTADTRTEIQAFKDSDQKYDLLFQIVDDVKQRASQDLGPQSGVQLDLSIESIDHVLEKYFAGNLAIDEARFVLQNLIASPHFYQRLLLRLDFILPYYREPRGGEENVLEGVEIKEESELLGLIKKYSLEVTPELHEQPAGIERSTEIHGRARTVLEKVERFRPFLIAAALLLAFSWISSRYFIGVNPDQFIYDDRVPHEYDSASILRGPSTPDTFEFSFLTAIKAYNDRDYAGAIEILDKLEPLLPALRNELPDSQYASKARDFYFYLGVSHLAAAQSQKNPLEQEERLENYQFAAHNLQQAKGLAEGFELREQHRESIFLAQAYGFSGQHRQALTILADIAPDSPYYSDAKTLKWYFRE